MAETTSTKNYLEEYDKASEDAKYPLVKKWMKTEPLPFFAQLRAERPILKTPVCTLVARFDDVRDILQMPKIFTVNLYKPKMGAVGIPDGYLMAYDDDALHYREKSIMQGMLNRNDLPEVRALIEEASADILKNAGGRIEIVQSYCRMVPAILVQDYFGLDGIDREDLIEWSFWNQYDVFHNQPFDLNPREKFQHIVSEHDRVNEELQAYIGSLILRKVIAVKIMQALKWPLLPFKILRRMIYAAFGKAVPEPSTDMVKRMLGTSFDKGVEFDLKRVAINAGGLLIGSIETTSQAVAQVIEYFLDNPELHRLAHAKAQLTDTAEFDAMVWEALRFVPISPYMFRQAAEDYTVAKGTDREALIDAGTNVLVLTQSAMFDTYAYSNPEVFQADRNWYHNFNFGFASHECLGKYVGMMMIPEMVRQVFRLHDLAHDGGIDYEDGPFPEKLNLNWG
ncbi:cytochrome P450 [Coralliovum pocilloporae]|uniref:cytochrome P450 n=1 Tax=Coralliovum pocilloporae TaxID=3066369 RepID=UPI003306E825